jgi:hypothetical protein
MTEEHRVTHGTFFEPDNDAGLRMPVIDTDATLMGESTSAALHAAEQTFIHITAEIDGRIPELMDTLVSTGPYAYTLIPEIREDGTVRLPVLSTAPEIREAYTMIRGYSDLLTVEPLVEIRGSWFCFQEALSVGQVKHGDVPPSENVTLLLFPVSTGAGITGELVWVVTPRAALGSGVDPASIPTDPVRLRRDVLAQHDREIEALQSANTHALLDCLNDGVASAVRDYVNDSGKLASLHGKDEHRAYYDAFFAKYDVESVHMLDRVVHESYAFAELRFSVTERGSGKVICFHTAEYHVPASDGRFIARIGHGTDTMPLESHISNSVEGCDSP